MEWCFPVSSLYKHTKNCRSNYLKQGTPWYRKAQISVLLMKKLSSSITIIKVWYRNLAQNEFNYQTMTSLFNQVTRKRMCDKTNYTNDWWLICTNAGTVDISMTHWQNAWSFWLFVTYSTVLIEKKNKNNQHSLFSSLSGSQGFPFSNLTV